jgi:hypothetical protein
MHRIRSLSSPENFPETSSSEYQKWQFPSLHLT